MKILLDNCVPKRAKRLLTFHDVLHASEAGMSQLSNGLLLKSAVEQGFEVLITVDQKIRHEHNLATLPVAVLELNTRDSRFPALQEIASHFEKALLATKKYLFVSLDKAGTVSCLADRVPARPSGREDPRAEGRER